MVKDDRALISFHSAILAGNTVRLSVRAATNLSESESSQFPVSSHFNH